jgi:4-hydroxybenzoate polyprenyltransferase
LGAFAASTIWLRPEVTLMLGAYAGMSFAYSSYFKQTLLIDVIVLAGLYTHRILTGGLAAEVSVSPWLLAFSAFFFLSLAFVKRYLELVHARERDHQVLARRAYRVGDLGLVENMGLACGFIAVLVLCLFISSTDVSLLYRSPELLWLMCPVMFYWIARIWVLARRGELDEDPVLFATRDLKSYMAGLLILIIVGTAASW